MVTKDGVYVLDMAAKIDGTADYLCKAKWGDVEFPPPFGREAYPEVNSQWPTQKDFYTTIKTVWIQKDINARYMFISY